MPIKAEEDRVKGNNIIIFSNVRGKIKVSWLGGWVGAFTDYRLCQ